jgi:hypothetical protein
MPPILHKIRFMYPHNLAAARPLRYSLIWIFQGDFPEETVLQCVVVQRFEMDFVVH